jgi:hypothetical protein
MTDLARAVDLVTDQAYVTRISTTGPDERFSVKQNRVLRALREAGAGKAEARELALQALAEVNGGAEIQASRGAKPTGRGEAAIEHWWVPAAAVRFS